MNDIQDMILYRLKFNLDDGNTFDKEIYVSKDELSVEKIVADSVPAGATTCEVFVMDFVGRFRVKVAPVVQREARIEALTAAPKESTLRDSPKAKADGTKKVPMESAS